MSPPPEEETDPLQTLLARVERDREERCREILQAARDEADAIRQEAYSRARQRLHRTVETERQRVRRRLRSVEAEQATHVRQRRHQRISNSLEKAWNRLEEALHKRWSNPQGREEWVRGALEQARHFLPPGTWTLTHPSSQDPEDLASDLTAMVDPDQVTLETEPSSGLSAGIRIRCGETEMDATPAGLMVDRERVRSWLLASIQHHRNKREPG
ncbi:hypothetical protein [Thiohalorhabdus sp.]|uniref:hypothetical protein n=1 Tax=Thiohalorhabdus sp. TaxID=3094134 RepID=UPI002FC351BD